MLTRFWWIGALSAAMATGAHAQTPMQDDPYQWLEDINGEKPMEWVRAQNARTEKALGESALYTSLYNDILAVLDSNEKIPGVSKIGDHYYNFWQDKTHVRGIWRRTTLNEYRKKSPTWETVLDLDALNKAEGKNWVWHGASCLRPEYTRCLVSLSPGGSDADTTREFDLNTKSFVKGGFEKPVAKGDLSWIDQDHVYVDTDFGAGSMTTSGYPRTTRLWTRGTPMSEAKVIYEGKADDMSISSYHDDTPGYERDFVSRNLAFYNDELYLRVGNALHKIDVPNSVGKSVVREWLLLELRDNWTVGGKTYAAGSLLATNFDAFMKGGRVFDVLFTPTATTSLASVTPTRNYFVLNVLDNVKNRLRVLKHDGKRWQTSEFTGAPKIGTVNVSAVDADSSDAVWMSYSDYITPSTLALAEIGKTPEVLKQNPVFFNADNLVVEQHFANSKDGTKVPFFIVHKKGVKHDGSNPTLLYGYGGFEVSLTPNYSGTIGKAWLERGGVYVVANIRGGGEYGPAWHQAALKQNRHKAYEDFAAVAEELSNHKITSPKHLAAMGGSNGGLLAGNMLTQYPELFGGIVIQVPLLDMKRYNKLLAGASWMAEYGNPDIPEEWAYIQKFSAYQLFDPAKHYPPTFIFTTTKDDRVHPGHARKMAAKMLAANKDVMYFENTEGGHGAGSTNELAAKATALTYTFLWKALDGK